MTELSGGAYTAKAGKWIRSTATIEGALLPSKKIGTIIIVAPPNFGESS